LKAWLPIFKCKITIFFAFRTHNAGFFSVKSPLSGADGLFLQQSRQCHGTGDQAAELQGAATGRRGQVTVLAGGHHAKQA